MDKTQLQMKVQELELKLSKYQAIEKDMEAKDKIIEKLVMLLPNQIIVTILKKKKIIKQNYLSRESVMNDELQTKTT